MHLAEESILSDQLLRQLISVGEVDVLIGLPTHNNAETVGQVVQVIRAGLLKYFPRERTAILNADGGSHDGTQDLVQAASISDARNSHTLQALRTMHCFSSQYPGEPSTGTALHAIMAAADLLRARACAVISPESNISPEWIDLLIRPAYQQDFDFIAPVYCRHKFEGLLVTNLLYPMTRAVYGCPIREPYAAEFGFSGRLAAHFLADTSWQQDVSGRGAELSLILAAIAGGFRLQQTFLGPKGTAERQPADVVLAMRQTVGTLFASLERYFSNWSAITEEQAIVTVGPDNQVATDPMRVNRKRLLQMFRNGVGELEPILSSILSHGTLEELKHFATVQEEEFQYADELWVKTVYEFAASYQHAVISRNHIIQALVPLFRGRAYGYLVRNRETSGAEVEQQIENLCQIFERLKPYLLELWKK